jgi:eukaryotic-like serine/threonine-protein kinase
MTTGRMFQFGEGFQVDVSARTLRRNEEVVTLSRRAFDVLLYLVQNPGRVLSRDELLKNAWPDTFVDESSLVQSIHVLRRALGEQSGDQNYIVTLPGRGYQFTSPVKEVAAESLSRESLHVLSGTAPDLGSPSGGIVVQQQTIQTSVVTQDREVWSLPARSRRLVGTTAVFLVAAISVAGIYEWRRIHRAPAATNPAAILRPPRRSIAVLGFRNLSGRPEEAWVSTALAEMLSTELVAGEKLRLVAGEDIARTKLELPLADADSLSRETLSRLHKNLDTDLVVLGSYTALGDKPETRIRLDLRLQDTAAGETVADIAVMGNEANLFDIVTDAGAQLRAKLGVEAVSPVEAVSVRASLPANREAARLYSEGLARLRVSDALAARDLLQQAIASDPKFALAHSALAEAWWRLGYDKNAEQEGHQAYDLSANLSREEKLVVEGRYREINHEHDKAIEIYRTLYILFPDNLDYGINLAEAQIWGDKTDGALATIASLRKLPAPASDDPRIDFDEAWVWNDLGDRKHEGQPLSQAVQKAREQGSRLLLARARKNQCSMLGSLGQSETALAACHEARDLDAAAGHKVGVADDLLTTAIVTQATDAPESVRLFLQALHIFRELGNEGSVADGLMDLGNLYSSQGDPVTAERMQRQALAAYRLIGNKINEARDLGNIADSRLDQGDLPGAIRFYEESMNVVPWDPGILARANIAIVHQLQGDLTGARQGLEQAVPGFQGSGDQEKVALLTWYLAGVLLEQADFSGARTLYEKSLAIWTASGEKLTIAGTQLGLAELSLEESRSPAEQESAMRKAIEVFQQQKSREDETRAWRVLARALLAQNKAAEAKDAAQHARALAAKSQNPEIRWRTAIAAATVETADKAAIGSAAGIAARKELESVIAQSRKLGYRIVELDARLALAEIEMKTGQTAAGRAHLTAIEAEAKAIGYNLVARKAAIARS